MNTISVNVKPFLAHFLLNFYKNQVSDNGVLRLPTSSPLYWWLHYSLKKRPKKARFVRGGNLTLALPYPKDNRRPETYNWLSDADVRTLERHADILLIY